jgi:hypothetical protein
MPVDGMVAAARMKPSTRSHWQLCYYATSSTDRGIGISEGRGRAAPLFQVVRAATRPLLGRIAERNFTELSVRQCHSLTLILASLITGAHLAISDLR